MSGGYTPLEGESDTRCDPFMTDVFLVGNMMLKHFIDGDTSDLRSQFGIRGLRFLRPLAKDMARSNPSKRPIIDEVVNRFTALVRKIPPRKLRSRAISMEIPFILIPFFALSSYKSWTRSVLRTGKPAIPLRVS
ncbi:hypothetical protein C8J55DRAFT_492458 [Lentinula edodes]|uniref:Protein kinase domain-containing protein n=1 Tax=Lentinula lateritia TaxID=40482 RepID=A0A9W9DFX0_9AGAR|nr:hypothetical protein C8J55DRAFT_492458 [Lentinula edodes]